MTNPLTRLPLLALFLFIVLPVRSVQAQGTPFYNVYLPAGSGPCTAGYDTVDVDVMTSSGAYYWAVLDNFTGQVLAESYWDQPSGDAPGNNEAREICVPAGTCMDLVITNLEPAGPFSGVVDTTVNGGNAQQLAYFPSVADSLFDLAGLGAGCDSCHPTVTMYSKANANTTGAGPCPVINTPCLSNHLDYCMVVTNTSTLPLVPGDSFVMTLPADSSLFTVNYTSSCAGTGVPVTANKQFLFTLGTNIPSGGQCEVCAEVSTGAALGSPHLVWGAAYPACGFPSFFQLDLPIDCACDPNDLTVSPSGCGPLNLLDPTELNHLVRFQNTGGGPATDVVIDVVLDDDLDLGTLSVLSSSHPITSHHVTPDGRLVVEFLGIGLPPELVDPLGSMGHVQFSVWPGPSPDYTEVVSWADIYFDSNAPVRTNSSLHTLLQGSTPQPHVTILSCEPGHARLLANKPGGGTYERYVWSPGGAEGPILWATEPGSYVVQVTDSNGCIGYSDPIQVRCSDDGRGEPRGGSPGGSGSRGR